MRDRVCPQTHHLATNRHDKYENFELTEVLVKCCGNTKKGWIWLESALIRAIFRRGYLWWVFTDGHMSTRGMNSLVKPEYSNDNLSPSGTGLLWITGYVCVFVVLMRCVKSWNLVKLYYLIKTKPKISNIFKALS